MCMFLLKEEVRLGEVKWNGLWSSRNRNEAKVMVQNEFHFSVETRDVKELEEISTDSLRLLALGQQLLGFDGNLSPNSCSILLDL
jgi:hypothetical protein